MVVSLLGLLLLVYLLLQLPPVQDFLRGRIVVYLENKLGTEVKIEKLAITFPKRIVLENVYFQDQRGDTLLAGEKLRVDIALFQLLNNRAVIKYLQLDGIRANIYRTGTDSVFNYQYILDAFATPATTPADSSAPMELDLDRIILNRVVADFRDDQAGMNMSLNVGYLHTDFDEINPTRSLYTIPIIELKNTAIRVKQYKPIASPRSMAEVEAKNQPPAFDLNLNTIDLGNVAFLYDNDVSNVHTDLQIGTLLTQAKSVDLNQMQIDLRELQMTGTNAKITFGATQQAAIAKQEIGKDIEAQANNPWRIQADRVLLADNNIQYDDNTQPRVVGAVDYAHMNVQGLRLDAANVVFTPETIVASFREGSLRETRSGFELRQLQGDLLYDQQQIAVENLLLQTDRTLLRRRVVLSYESLGAMTQRPGDIHLQADLNQSTVAVRDIIAFVPALRDVTPFKGNLNEVFFIDAGVNGFIKDLHIPRFNVSSFRNTAISASGNIKGLPGDNPVFRLNISSFSTTNADIAAFLPKGAIPPDVRIPERLYGRASFNGSPTNYTTSLTANTSRGNVDLAATMNGTRFNARVHANALDVGYIFQQQDVGRVSLQANVSGNGFDYQRSPIDIDAYVSSARISGYDYNNLKFTGKLRNGVLTGEGDIKDSNADLDFSITSDLSQANPSLSLQMKIDSIDLGAIGLSDVPFRLHGNINVDMPSLNMASLSGNAMITDVVFVRDGQRYVIDTITLDATPDALRLRSALAVLDLEGRYNLLELGNAVQNIIHQYYTIPGYQAKPLSVQQDWTLRATIFSSPELFAFVPELEGSDSITLEASLNTAANDLQVLARTQRLQMSGVKADSVTIRANTTADQLVYSATAEGAQMQDLRFYRTSIQGNVMNDLLSARMDVKDAADKSRYQLSAIAQSIPGGFRFSLNQDSLMFDYNNWAVGAGNYIESTDRGIIVNNFTISNGNQSLSANSRTATPNSPIDLNFSNFEIGTITAVAGQEQLLMGGTINGNAVVSQLDTRPIFTSDLRIDNLSYKGDTLGNLTAKVNNQTDNTLAADLHLFSEKNDVRATGSYIISSETLDMDLAMNKFDLSVVQPFMSEQLRDIGGSIRGNMSVSGKLTVPKLDGTIRFDSAYVVPSMLGERFYLPNQELAVSPEGIQLDNFVIRDSLGGEAVINGSIATTDFSEFYYDFFVTAEDFRVMNTNRTSNSEYYGELNVDVDMAVYGSISAPTLEGVVRVNEKTNFFAVLPGSNPEVVSREGVVRFVDADNPYDSVFLRELNPLDSIVNSIDIAGLDLALTIETDTAAQFNLIVNELTGDILSMRGRADLSAGIDRSGKISLTGNYEVNSGYYELSFEFIRRRFDIQRGSSVTWTGDPTQAIIDVTAIHTAETSPINLVAPQLGESTASLNQYKQRLPFNVILNLNGEILEPVISFDITMPEGYAAAWGLVDQKLAQIRRDEAELNKQVFALLLLGRFVQENPFQDAGAGVTVESLARQSVARVLTEQLNQWSNELLPGFGLTFGVTSMEDYSTGELRNRTDLNVTLSRQINDRIRLTVGSNFELEGPSNANNPAVPATGFASDVAIDYLLSKDGKYMMRAYRRNIFEVLVEGQVVETGLRFILTMDYNQFRELFRRKKADDALPSRRRTTTNTSEQVPQPETEGVDR